MFIYIYIIYMDVCTCMDTCMYVCIYTDSVRSNSEGITS